MAFYEKMSTVLRFDLKGGRDPKIESEVNRKVEKKIREVVDKLKAAHEKFVDPDFGPNDEDPFGAVSLYGTKMPDPALSKYPAPDSLKWERPMYEDAAFTYEADGHGKVEDAGEEGEGEEGDDAEGGGDDDWGDEFDDDYGPQADSEDDGVWCKYGKLFVDGSSSGDVVQGQLGDCWFLSALAVMGTQEKLIRECFWKEESFKEFGLFVCRFFKDCSVMYVIVDDRIPVRRRDGKVVFGRCKDPNELWVPLIEKAYAKLHGCYKALIGGFTHFGLGDLTGFCPHQIILQKGFAGFDKEYSDDELWKLLKRYRDWDCLMGCSIQPNPQETHRPEEKGKNGLITGHAYSLLSLGEVQIPETEAAKGARTVRLVRIRNPWGRGEWEGPWGDRSDEFAQHQDAIKKAFDEGNAQEVVVEDFNDGTFFIEYGEWRRSFNALFMALSFPDGTVKKPGMHADRSARAGAAEAEKEAAKWVGKRVTGRWTGDTGGNRKMGTWKSNPKYSLKLGGNGKESYEMFVGLYINDSRLTLGQEYYRDPLYATPLAFDIIPRRSFDKDFGLAPGGKGGKGSSVKDLDSYEAPYNYGTTQKEEIMLKANEEYYIIPSLYTREQPGDYYISVFAECDFSLQGGTQLTADMQPMVLANPDKKTVDGAGGNAGKEMGKTKQLSMTVAQFYERKEELRSKMVSEMIRLGYSQRSVQSVFESDFPDVGEARASPSTDAKVHKKPLRFDDFKRKLVEKGFSLADFPTDDFIVLDEDNNGEIEYEELMKFLDEGFEFARGTNIAKAPPPPVDDTLYKSVNLEGQLTVAINRARDLRKAKTWFSNIEETTSDRITVDCDLPNAMTDTSSLSSSLPFAPEVSRGSGGAISAAALTNSAHMNRAGGTSVANKTMRSTVSLSPIPEKTVPRDKSTSSLPPPPPNEDANNVAKTRPLIQYDPMEAKKVHAETRKQWETDRKHAFVSRLHKKEKAKQQQQQQMMMMSTTMGSFMPEVSTSPRKKSPTAMDSSFAFPVPDTFRSTFQDDDVPPTGRSGITTTRRDMIAKVANDAATKLHTESSLQAAEKNRTERLLKLKSRREKEAAKTKAEAIQATAMLHQKSSTANKVSSSKFRDIHHKSAQEILKMIGINHDEHRGYIPHSQYKDRRIENLKRAKDSKSKANDEDADTLNPETTAKPATSPRPDLHPENTGNESNKGISTQTIKNGDLELTLTVKEEQEDVQGVDIIESRPNSVHVMKDGVEVIDDSRQHDIFDDIIDVVLTIVDSRSAESKAKKMIEFNKLLSSPSAIPASNFTLFNPEPSPLPSPAGKPQMVSARKGTVDVPVGRKTPGIASVKMGMSPASLTPAQRKMQMKGSLTILRELERQQQQTYQEVYRRLVSVPTTTFGEIEGERRAIMSQSMTGDIMRDCFNRIDIDRNGLLSSTEFLRFLRSRSIAVTEEDALTLFERFETNERDGNIDWTEFSGFFERNISSNRLRRSKPDYRPLEVLLQELRMKARNYSKVSGQAIEASPMRKSLKKGGDGEDNGYVIFNSLKVESVGSNAEILRDLGMKDLTNAEMMRISRVFQYNVQNLMRFLRSGQEQGTVVYEHAETIEQAVGKIREIIVNKCLRERIGCETDDATPFDRAKMKKLWSAISASDEVEWDKVTQFFVDMIKQYTHAMLKNKKMAELALQLKSPTASAILGTPHPNPKEGEETYQFELLVRIVVDGMMHSFWNRNFLRGTRIQAAQLTKYPAVIHMLSFTGFEAYIREDYVDSLERKMRYLVHTEKNLLSGSVNLLVHVYLRSDRKNFIVLAYDPISGEVYSSQVNEDVSALPLSTKTTNEIADVVYEKYRDERLSKVVQQNTQQICSRYAFYDPVQTPYEDAALGGMVRRIRLLRGDNSKAKLVFAEDKRFVDQLRGIIDADVNLPFFSVVNDLSVSFEVDNDAIESEVSIQQHIFGSIRQSRALMSFLTTTLSDMRVILCSYNSGIRSTMPWAEMLAHLNNYRNPFVVVQLLPRFVRPTGYCYRVRDDQSAHDGVSDTDPLAPRRGRVCTDGGSMPAWDANVFKMNFKPPKLNMCNVLSTAVAKLKVEGASKYVVVMVREGKRTKRALDGKDTDNDDDDVDDDESDDESDEDEDGSDGLDAAKREESGKGRETRRETEKFWFLTVYDPRSSTEFQCGAKDQHSKFGKMLYNLEKFWAEYKERPESIKKHSAKLLAQETRDALLGESYVNDVLDIFLEQLEDAADSDQLVLGPAITPRLLISVYNRKGRSEELLGSAEVSVSSVLSSANTSAWKWVTLTHTREMAGKEFVEKAGEILVDLSFINKSEIQAAKQAEKERIKRLDNLQRQRSDEADDLSRVSKPAARSGRAAGRAGDVDGVCMQNLPTQSVPVQAAATNGAAKPEAGAAKAEAEMELEAARKTLEDLRREKGELQERVDEERKRYESAATALEEREREVAEMKPLLTTTAKAEGDNSSPVGRQTKPAEVTALKAALTSSEAKLVDSDAKLMELKQQYDDLKASAEQMRREANENVNKQLSGSQTQSQNRSSASTNPTHGASGKKPLTDSSMSRESGVGFVAPISAFESSDALKDLPPEQILRGLLEVFLRRYEARGGSFVTSNRGPLDSFQRMLQAYSNTNGHITRQNIREALADLLIETSVAQVEALHTQAGEPQTAAALVDFLKSHLEQVSTFSTRSTRLPTHSNRKSTTHMVVSPSVEGVSGPGSTAEQVPSTGKGRKGRKSEKAQDLPRDAQPLQIRTDLPSHSPRPNANPNPRVSSARSPRPSVSPRLSSAGSPLQQPKWDHSTVSDTRIREINKGSTKKSSAFDEMRPLPRSPQRDSIVAAQSPRLNTGSVLSPRGGGAGVGSGAGPGAGVVAVPGGLR